MNLPDLPQDILDEIFSYIPAWHLFPLMCVSKDWKRMLENSIKIVNCVNRIVKLSFLLRVCTLPRLTLVRFTSSPPQLNALSRLTTLNGLMISDFQASLCRIALEHNQNNNNNNNNGDQNESFEYVMKNASQLLYITSLHHYPQLTSIYPYSTLPLLNTDLICAITVLKHLTRLYLSHEVTLMNIPHSRFDFLHKLTTLRRLELQVALNNEFLAQLTQLYNLRFLWLVDTSHATDTSLLTFPLLSGLTTIELSTHRQFSLSDFVKQPRLQSLKFHQTLNLQDWEQFSLLSNLVSLKLILGTELNLQTQIRYIAGLVSSSDLLFIKFSFLTSFSLLHNFSNSVVHSFV
jgi:hypothetical protein